MRKRKVLFINGHMNYGGIEKSLLEVLRNLNYHKYEVDLLLIEDKGDYFEEIPKDVNIIFKNLNNTYGPFLKSCINCITKKDYLSLFTRFLILIKKVNPSVIRFLHRPLFLGKKYDVAIAYRTGFCTDILEYAVAADNKTSWWHHGEINLYDREWKDFIKACKTFNKLVVVSRTTASILIEKEPELETIIQVIPNMIDDLSIKSKSQEFIPEFDFEKKNLITVCRMSPEKHLENIIFASEILISKGFTNFSWHILGNGEDEIKLKEHTKEKHLEEYIFFEGKKANPYPYIKHSDIYVHTSYVESQGLSILEAMILQKPCIITYNKGIMEYATGKNCIIAKQNPLSLAESILTLVQEPGLEKEIVKEANKIKAFEVQEVNSKLDALLYSEF